MSDEERAWTWVRSHTMCDASCQSRMGCGCKEDVQELIAAIRAEENEACARIAQAEQTAAYCYGFDDNAEIAGRILNAIRARREVKRGCEHEWIDPSNEVVNANGYLWCPKCGDVKHD